MTDDRLQTALWIGLACALIGLFYLLGPILTPFLLAATLAYICDPLVERLERRRLPRNWAVVGVILALLGALILLVLTLVPLVRDETRALLTRLPDWVHLLNDRVSPWLADRFGLRLKVYLTPEALRQMLTDNWDSVQTVITQLLSSAASGGQTLIELVSTLLLTPVALFYLLRDWNQLLARGQGLIPRPWASQVLTIAKEVDQVLAEFLRGQLLVMLLLAAYYALALTVAGINFALPLGLITGLLVFIPYVGFSTGFVLALAVAGLQFDGLGPVIAVLVVFGLGQLLESFILTPFLVGDRIGLHPLAVIFALLAFGQLFGFVGVLVALPASAALLVGLRHLRGVYLASRFYNGNS